VINLEQVNLLNDRKLQRILFILFIRLPILLLRFNIKSFTASKIEKYLTFISDFYKFYQKFYFMHYSNLYAQCNSQINSAYFF